jgi:hypothetical protein
MLSSAKMATRAINRKILSAFKLLVGFRGNFKEVFNTIPSSAHHQHVLFRCTKLPLEHSCREFTGQAAGGFKQKFTVVIRPYLIVHNIGMFRLLGINGYRGYIKKILHLKL